MNLPLLDQLQNNYNFKTPYYILNTEIAREKIFYIRQLCDKHKIRLFFAFKSFSHPNFIDFICPYVDGFDVSNQIEFHQVKKTQLPISVTSPSGFSEEDLFEFQNANLKMLNVDGQDEFQKFIDKRGIYGSRKIQNSFSARLDLSTFLATLPVSRFGIAWDELLKYPQLTQLHMHPGDREKIPLPEWQKLLTAIRKNFTKLVTINLGGGWHKVPFDSIDSFLSMARSILGAHVEIVIEPGKFFSQSHLNAYAHIKQINRQKKYITLNISALNHLSWSQFFPSYFCDDDHTHEVTLFGPSCYENDFLGKIKMSDKDWNSLKVGNLFEFRGVSGYAWGRQSKFNGLEPAALYFYFNGAFHESTLEFS